MRSFFILLLCLWNVDSSAEALSKFRQFLAQSGSGSATFEQTVIDKSARITQKASGTFVYSRPGKFRWAYDKPKQLIVGDGARIWIYDEDLNQVTVRKIDQAISATPAALLAGGAVADNLFDMKEQGIQDGLEWLEARPKKADTSFERIRIGFSGDQLAAMELYDQFGSHTVLRFIDLKRNPRVDASLFKFTPPKGADVVGE